MRMLGTIIGVLILFLSTLYVLFGAFITGAIDGGSGIAGYQTQLGDYMGLVSLPFAYYVFILAARGKIPFYWLWLSSIAPVIIIYMTGVQ